MLVARCLSFCSYFFKEVKVREELFSIDEVKCVRASSAMARCGHRQHMPWTVVFRDRLPFPNFWKYSLENPPEDSIQSRDRG